MWMDVKQRMHETNSVALGFHVLSVDIIMFQHNKQTHWKSLAILMLLSEGVQLKINISEGCDWMSKKGCIQLII